MPRKKVGAIKTRVPKRHVKGLGGIKSRQAKRRKRRNTK